MRPIAKALLATLFILALTLRTAFFAVFFAARFVVFLAGLRIAFLTGRFVAFFETFLAICPP